MHIQATHEKNRMKTGEAFSILKKVDVRQTDRRMMLGIG